MALYIGILTDTIEVYDANADGDALPIRTITGPNTGVDGVTDVVLDAGGNLYESNAASSKVHVFAPGANGNVAPIRTLAGPSTGLAVPQGLALDSAGNLYVLNTGGLPANRTITVYAPGADGDAAPIRTLTGIQVADGNLNGIGIDLFDFLYLAEDIPEIISVFAPGANGAVTPVRTISGASTGLVVPVKLAFDSSNNLYVANGLDVRIFASGVNGDVAPIGVIGGPSTGISNAFDLGLDESGQLYVGDFPADFSAGSITVYAAGATGNVAPVRTITGVDTGLGVPSGGIALDPPGITQDNWRWCNKCQGLFFAGNPTTGACPAEGGHDYSSSGNYVLWVAPGAGQDNWRWCNKCQGLFFAGNATTGACPAEGGHDYSGSGDYRLLIR